MMKNLQTAAADFLSTMDLVSWEPGHRTRTLSLLQQFLARNLDADCLRAALGAFERSQAPRAQTRSTAVLPLIGVLTPGESLFTILGLGTSVRGFVRDLRAAADDRAIKSVVVVTDSPGGLISMVPEAAAEMRNTRAKKPVLAACAGLNCSSAYWITSNATTIEATPSARVGAIGVVSDRVSVARMLERDGVDVEVFSAGKFKAEGHEATPITADERRAIQGLVDEAYAGFVSDVSAGRRVPASLIRGGFGEGRPVSAAEAHRLGMIDRVDLVEHTIARAASAPADAQARRSEHIAWQNRMELELLGLSLPGLRTPARASDARVQNRLDRERIEVEVALLGL